MFSTYCISLSKGVPCNTRTLSERMPASKCSHESEAWIQSCQDFWLADRCVDILLYPSNCFYYLTSVCDMFSQPLAQMVNWSPDYNCSDALELLYCYRDRRFRNTIAKLLRLKKPAAIQSAAHWCCSICQTKGVFRIVRAPKPQWKILNNTWQDQRLAVH